MERFKEVLIMLNPQLEISRKLLAYRQFSIRFWQGWMRHHSAFIQGIIDSPLVHSEDLIRTKFIVYLQKQDQSVELEGDFAEICRFLKVEIPEHAIKPAASYPRLREAGELFEKIIKHGADRDYMINP